MRVPAGVRKLLEPVIRKAESLKLPLYAVGGCVRDWSLGLPCKDLDLTMEGDPRPLAAVCERILKVRGQAFDDFGTLRFAGTRYRLDLARSRQEIYPEPASLPVVSPASIQKDLFRRDFTINAMALSLGEEKRLLDPYGGQKDLGDKVLRVLHPASFRDDPTRVFRGARFKCRFGLSPAPGFMESARAALEEGIAGRLSRHRLAQELLRVLEEKDPSCALRVLKAWGYLDLLHPGHPGLVAPAAFRVRDAWGRLGVLALSLGEEAGAFFDSLPLDRTLARPLRQALEASRRRAAPRGKLEPLALRVLAEVHRGLPPSALKPAWLTGKDLLARGLKPGPKFSRILDEAARRQWSGLIRSRSQALAWLRSTESKI